MDVSLAPFSPATRAWFDGSFEAPTDAQTKGWKAIAEGRHTLLLAPTGSGKTLAAFLAAIDRLTTTPPPGRARGHPARRGTGRADARPRAHRRGAHGRHRRPRAAPTAEPPPGHPHH